MLWISWGFVGGFFIKDPGKGERVGYSKMTTVLKSVLKHF